jgi:hypothetical protein
MTSMNKVTPKVAAKLELMFDQPDSDSPSVDWIRHELSDTVENDPSLRFETIDAGTQSWELPRLSPGPQLIRVQFHKTFAAATYKRS